jgi:hypothetical protein
VLITLKQGNDINKQFSIMSDSIKKLNLSIEKHQIESDNKYQQLNLSTIKHKAEADSFKYMYNQNKKIYKKHEDWWNTDRRHYTIMSAILMFTTIFFAAL